MTEQEMAKAVRTALGLEGEASLDKVIGDAVDTRLAKAVGDAVKPLHDEIATLRADIAKQPEPAKGQLRSLGKADDGVAAVAMDQSAMRAWAQSDPVAFMKWSQQQPGSAYHIDPVNGITPLNAG